MNACKMQIGVLTSGGDAPGMNAALRAIVRTAASRQAEVIGFRRGYRGILERQTTELTARSVSNIIQRGGTILGSARCPEFRKTAGVRAAADNLRKLKIDALLVIGGNGTMRGAVDLQQHWDGNVVGVPGTIDNDLRGTDWTIGFFTALNTAMDAIDRIRDTAEAFDRIFLIEVMGRNSGWIGLLTGIAGGAEEMLLPEHPMSIDALAEDIELARSRGKGSFLVVVSEGIRGGVEKVASEISERTGFETRSCVLGHLQRGGSPEALDRYLGTRFGAKAIESVFCGRSGVMVGQLKGEDILTPLPETFSGPKQIPLELLEMNRSLTL